jgi:hypothetical protein
MRQAEADSVLPAGPAAPSRATTSVTLAPGVSP